MQNIGSRAGSWRRLVSVAGIVVLALAYFGSSAALAAGDPAITSASEAYFHTGVLTTFTVTTTGSPVIALTESGALPAGLTFTDNGDGTATLSGTALPGQEGDHDITITATNAVGHVDQPFTIEVGTVCSITTETINPPYTATFIEGEPGTHTVTATDDCPGGTDNWGTPVGLPSGVLFPNPDNGNAGGVLAGTPGPGTAAAGPYTFTITDSDGDASGSHTFTLTVAPPLVVTPDVFSSTESVLFSGQVAHFTGGNGPFTATIDWGDAISSPGVVAGTNVNGSHNYAEEGPHSVTVHVTAAGTTVSSTLGETTNDDSLSSQDEGPVTFSANEGANFSGKVSDFDDFDIFGTASDYFASIAWGDGNTSAGTIAGPDGGPFTVNGAHIYDEHGVYSGTVTITDVGGATTGNSITATIAEVSPLVVTGKNISETVGVGFTTLVATFNDPGSKEATSDYNVRIDWGDGTATDLTGTVGDPPGVLTVTGTHTYAAIGTYTITIGAEEADGQVFDIGTGSATVTALPLTSAPSRPQPFGLLIATFSLLLAITGVVAWRRRATRALVQ